MKFLRTSMAVISLLMVGTASASNPWFIGATHGFYSLGEGDHWKGEIDIGQAGLQVGKYLSNDLSVEAGYSVNFNREDFQVGSLSALFWMGDSKEKYQPYLLIGTSVYNFDDESDMRIQHRHSQAVFGVGIGSKVTQGFQVRADVRLMARNKENEGDFGFQFSINRMLPAGSSASN